MTVLLLMKRIIKQVLSTLLLAVAANTTGAQGLRAQPKVGRASLVGVVRGSTEVESCGCYLRLPSESARSNRYVFYNDFDNESVLMNINGRNVKLKLIKSTQPTSRSLKLKERFSEWYISGKIKVRLDFITTGVCDPNDEGCESVFFKTNITATDGTHRQIVKTVGGCGC
jgi:hypothetical protein